MLNYPRFRYFLLTATSERGSPLVKYEVLRVPEGEQVSVQPERRVTAPEFSALKAGFLLWHTEYLKKPTSEPVFKDSEEIQYIQRITSYECYANALHETHFLPEITERLAFAASQSTKSIRNIQTALELCSADDIANQAVEWKMTVAQMFAAAAPILLVDEILLRRFEGTVAEAITDIRSRSSLIQEVYSSQHLRDIVLGRGAALPQSKAWSKTPPPISIPNSHALTEIVKEHMQRCFRIYNRSGISSSRTNSILEIGPQIFIISEAIHYILGGLLLAGNHLWLHLEPSERSVKDWGPSVARVNTF